MNDFEKFNIVVSTINKVLKEQGLEDNKLLACTMDDHGNCIHATIWGAVELDTVKDICKSFGGDDNPHIYVIDKDDLQIVFFNDREDLLIECNSLEASFDYQE